MVIFNSMAKFKIENISSSFRQLVDIFFFTNRTDFDLSNFKIQLAENFDHHRYFWNCFKRSTDISWENNQELWDYRFRVLLDIVSKNTAKNIEDHLRKKMFLLLISKPKIHIKYDQHYLQLIKYCQIKYEKRESLKKIRNFLIEMPAFIRAEKALGIVENFLPYVFKDMSEYVAAITTFLVYSDRSFDLLLTLEKHGHKFNKNAIINLANEILLYRNFQEDNIRAFFNLINNPDILDGLKKKYKKDTHRERLLEMLDECRSSLLEERHMGNIKNLVALDPKLANEIGNIYIDDLCLNHFYHKRSAADRIIKLINKVPEISSKKILAKLAGKGKMLEIKYLIQEFPNLKTISSFL